jgi:hypothetical protein
MAELKNNLSGDINQHDAFVAAILGTDEDITDELAGEVLAFYGIGDLDLIESFKSSISEKLRELPVEDDNAKRLGGMLRNLRDYQKDISGAKLSPKDRISQIFGGIFTPPVAASYAFRGKDESGLSDSDQAILDELKKELLDESGDDNE